MCLQNSEFHRSEFYPGQYLSGKLSQFSFAKWLEGGPDRICGDTPLKMRHKLKVVARVEKVQVVSLGVQVRPSFASLDMHDKLLANHANAIRLFAQHAH